MRLPFIPSAYSGRSIAHESARLINLYPEIAGAPGAASVAMLIGTPGLRLFSDGVPSPVRGAIVGPDDLLYVVQSNVLLRVDSTGQVSATLGSLNTSTGRVSMRQNGALADGIGGNQIIIADGAAIYIYNTATEVFTTLAKPFTHVEFIDGYFIGIDGTMNAYASELYDGLTWNDLATTPVQASSDSIRSVLSLYQQLFFIKEYSTEIYYNNSVPTSQGFPYSRMAGAVINYGTPAPWSVALGGASVFFLAHERAQFVGVVMLQGYMPTVVSPPAIIWHMSQSTDLSQCFGYCYSDEGHTFYVLTNPVDNWTWVYDSTTQMWHERVSGCGDGRHIGNCYVKAYGKHLVGDHQSGRLYEMSSRFYTDAGQPLVSIQRTQHLSDSDMEEMFVGSLQVDVESGVGTDGPATPATATAVLDTEGGVGSVTVTDSGADYTGSATVLFNGDGTGAAATATVRYGSVTSVTVTNPGSGYSAPPEVIIAGQPVTATAALSISKDGGHTWGSEYPRSLGGPGEHRKRLIWSPIGRAHNRVFQIRISSPCKRVLFGYVVKPA